MYDSVFTGGFGGDRFYLKYWRSGLGKLLTFGGLGKLKSSDTILYLL